MKFNPVSDLAARTGREIRNCKRIAGGDAAEAWKIEFADGYFGFLKSVQDGAPFPVEASGLRKLVCTNGMKVPEVLLVSDDFLLLEWIQFSQPSPRFQSRMGEALAWTHRMCRGKRYGFEQDHFIGVTPQMNTPEIEPSSGAWAEFWWTHRLEPMLNRLGNKDLRIQGEQLAAKLPERLPDPEGEPSLLHGDLWSGNVGADSQGNPVMFDPAPSYGHPEADLGMTRMFGGFTKDFYAAYNRVNPLSNGWEQRLDLYMLYHVLNHACIFGAGYTHQAAKLISSYI